jgi:hypothetical protein
MGTNDKIQGTIDSFIDSVSTQELTLLETLGVLSFLQAFYQSHVLDGIEAMVEEVEGSAD